jgi:hypothetical protein
VGLMGVGLVEYWSNGRLSLESKSMGGEVVARLFELRQSTPHLDFAAVARVQGLKVLRARHAALDQPQEFPEVPAIEIIDELLAVVDRVTAAMAN